MPELHSTQFRAGAFRSQALAIPDIQIDCRHPLAASSTHDHTSSTDLSVDEVSARVCMCDRKAARWISVGGSVGEQSMLG